MSVASVGRNTLQVITPGVSPAITMWLTIPGQVLCVASRLGRKIRILRNPNNYGPLFAGMLFDAAAGQHPTAKNAARVIFGSASLVKCSEKILEITNLAKQIVDIFRGRSYVLVKRKRWDPHYFDKMQHIKNPILIKRFFHCVGDIFKQFALLTLYFSDAIMAYRENTTSEIFVHSKDLLDKLTDDQAPIGKYLKRYEKVNDMMMHGLGLSWSTTALVGLFTLGAKIRKEAPTLEEMISNFKSHFGFVRERFEMLGERIQVMYLDLAKIFFENVPSIKRKFDFYDPDKFRYIETPIWKQYVYACESPAKQPNAPERRASVHDIAIVGEVLLQEFPILKAIKKSV